MRFLCTSRVSAALRNLVKLLIQNKVVYVVQIRREMNMYRFKYTDQASSNNAEKYGVDRRRMEGGSSLLQTAFTLIVVGVLVGASVAIIQPMVLDQPKAATAEQVKPIRTAISEFAARYGRLPCPARFDAAPNSADFGREYCDATPDAGSGVELSDVDTRDGRFVRSGGLPVRTLDMPDEFFLDGHKKPFLYTVTELVTMTSGSLNHDGGIYVRDENGQDVTVNEGWALYTVVSTGARGRYDDCDATKRDGENCDRDGLFTDAEASDAFSESAYFDDVIVFSEREPSDPYSLCGSKGKVYAPAQTNRDRDDCISVMSYSEYDTARIVTTQEVSCGTSSDFCEDEWVSLMSVTSGDYVFHWDTYLRFDYAQPSQYAVIDFKMGNEVVESRQISFSGGECEPEGQLQHIKGVSRLATEYGDVLQARIKLYGGDYNAARCGGEQTKLSMVSVGEGGQSSKKSMTLRAFSRYGEGKSVGKDLGSVTNPFTHPDSVAYVTNVAGTAFVTRDDGGAVEEIVSAMEIKKRDFVETASDGTVTLVFLDGTEITLSENSQFDIDQYDYDNSNGSGEAEYSLMAGVLLYIGGLLDGNGDVTINTAAGSVGIRGTAFILRVDVVDKTIAADKKIVSGPNGMMELVSIECCVDVALPQLAHEDTRGAVAADILTLAPGEIRSAEEMVAIQFFVDNLEDYAVTQPTTPWEKVVTLNNRRPQGMNNEFPAQHSGDMKTMRDDIVTWYNKGHIIKELHPFIPEFEPQEDVDSAVNIMSVTRDVSDQAKQVFYERIVEATSKANQRAGIEDAAGEEPIPVEPIEAIDTTGGEEPVDVSDANPCAVNPRSADCAEIYEPLACGIAAEVSEVFVPAEADLCRGGDPTMVPELNRGGGGDAQSYYKWECQKDTPDGTEHLTCQSFIPVNWLGILYEKNFGRQPDEDAKAWVDNFSGGESMEVIQGKLAASCEAKGTCSDTDANCRALFEYDLKEVCTDPICSNSFKTSGKDYMLERMAQNSGCSVTTLEDAFTPDKDSCVFDCDGWRTCDVSCDMPDGHKDISKSSDYCKDYFIVCTHGHEVHENAYYKCEYGWKALPGELHGHKCDEK